MAIVGMNYTKIQAERKTGVMGKTEIKTTPKILDVVKAPLTGLGNKIDVLNIKFEFESIVEPEKGNINIEGAIIYRTDKIKEILKQWKKDETLPAEVHVEVINYLFMKVTVLALQLSDALQMPPVVGMPRVEAK